MTTRYTSVRIIRNDEIIKEFDPCDEPNIFKDIMAALTNDQHYGGYGNDTIIRAQFFTYTAANHWIIELAEKQ